MDDRDAIKEYTDFFMVLDDTFFKYAALGLKTIGHFHPQSRVFLYDLSPSPSARFQQLAGEWANAHYRHWPEKNWIKIHWVDTLDFAYFHRKFNWRDQIKYLSRKWRHQWLGQYKDDWILEKKLFAEQKKRAIHIWVQKASCCLDCFTRTERNLVYLDADAFIWRRVDPVFQRDFDIGLTLRRLKDIKIGEDVSVRTFEKIPYHAVNAGVIYFQNTLAAKSFVEAWIFKMHNMKYFIIDQTALSQMIYEADPEAFNQYEKVISFQIDQNRAAKVLMLPCEQYNNIYIKDDFFFDEPNPFVVHLKGYLHQEKYFQSIADLVERRISSTPPDR
jgi:hypothetical protein